MIISLEYYNYFLDLFRFDENKIDNPHKAVFFLGKDVFDDNGKYVGVLTAVLKNKVEVKFEEEFILIDYPIYHSIIKNKEVEE